LRAVAIRHQEILAPAVEGLDKLDKTRLLLGRPGEMEYHLTLAAHPVFMLEVEALAFSALEALEAVEGRAEAAKARALQQAVLVAPTRAAVAGAEMAALIRAHTLAGLAW